MGTLIVWLIVGLIAGGVASLIVPGRTPGGVIGAIVVGILGGILGGWIFDLLGAGDELSWIGSLIAAIIGAVIILYVLRSVRDRDAGARRQT